MSSVEFPAASSAALPALPGAEPASGGVGGRSEGAIVLLVAAVQLVNVLEFMIVMPLGPDFAQALSIPVDSIGLIGGAYTAAAALAGLVGAVFLDRFDRRKALALVMAGLVMATAAGAMATGLATLIAARVAAGLFGGPATSLALSIVADAVPPARRGRAMAVVMGAFSIASVLGVPAGLELARLHGWRAPLLAVAALAAVVAASCVAALPPMIGHLVGGRAGEAGGFRRVLSRPGVALALLATAMVMVATFAIVPNIPAFLQFNAGFPRERFGLLYFIGGLVSLVVMAIAGRQIDRIGTTPAVVLSALVLTVDLALTFLGEEPHLPALAFFVLFMAASSVRNVAMNALLSRVPPASERARFQSCVSAVQHLAAAVGAFVGTRLLIELPDRRLGGLPTLGAMSVVLTLLMPGLVLLLELRVRAAERAP